LVLNIDIGEESGGWIYNIGLLLSPSIKEITVFDAYTNEEVVMVSALLAMLKDHGTDLEEITYNGLILPPVLHNILSFSSLRYAVIRTDSSNVVAPVDQPHFAALQIPCCLKTLVMDLLGVTATGKPEFGKWLTGLEPLTTLSLQGYWTDFRDWIFSRSSTFTFPRLHHLKLTFDPQVNPPVAEKIDPSCFSLISSTFPNLKSITVQNLGLSETAWTRPRISYGSAAKP
jgi:hypothetical protein